MKNKKIDIVILVGGFGTRIKKYLKGKPKPIAKIRKYIFLDLLIRNFCRYDINKVYILAGYKGEMIKKKYHDTKINLVDLECIVEKKPLGTGGCLAQLKSKIKNDFIVVNGDTYFDLDLKKIINYPIKKNQILMSLVKNKNYKSNSKLINLNLKKDFVYNDEKSDLINGGIYKFNKYFLKNLKKANISLEKQILPKLIENKNVKGIFFNNYFLDIGTPKNYFEAQKKLIKYMTKPAVFLDRDQTIIKDNGYTHKIKDLKFLKSVINGLKILSIKNCYIFIVTNQAGIGKGIFTLHQFFKFQKEIKKRLLKKNIFIHDVEFSPYHIDAKIKKYRKNSLFRKPGNLMIEKIKKNWPINLRKSFMIGDRKTDEICAKKSNLRFFYTKNDFEKVVKKKINNYL